MQRISELPLRALPTETKVESGMSQSKSGASINLRNSRKPGARPQPRAFPKRAYSVKRRPEQGQHVLSSAGRVRRCVQRLDISVHQLDVSVHRLDVSNAEEGRLEETWRATTTPDIPEAGPRERGRERARERERERGGERVRLSGDPALRGRKPGRPRGERACSAGHSGRQGTERSGEGVGLNLGDT